MKLTVQVPRWVLLLTYTPGIHFEIAGVYIYIRFLWLNLIETDATPPMCTFGNKESSFKQYCPPFPKNWWSRNNDVETRRYTSALNQYLWMILLISWSKRHLKWSKRLKKQTQKTGESLTCFFLCCVMSTWTHKERLFYIRGFLRRATTFSLVRCITSRIISKRK